MSVAELMALLAGQNPNAEVVIEVPFPNGEKGEVLRYTMAALWPYENPNHVVMASAETYREVLAYNLTED